MAMPAARGLFHKAAVHSASSLKMNSAEPAAKIAALTLANLGLSASQVDQLQALPHDRLFGAAMAAVRQVRPRNAPGTIRAVHNEDRPELAPVVDGKLLPAHPFDPVAPAISAHVPLLIGCCFNENGHAINQPELEASTEQEVRARVRATYGERGDRVYDAYRDLYPRMKPFDLQSQIVAALHRVNAVMQSDRMAALGTPVYHWMFQWQTPVLDGRPRAFHCAELPFAFDNADRAAAMTGGGDRARALAAKMADAWVAFARTGDPNHAGLPTWPRYDAARGQLMVFDDECVVKDDYDRSAREVFGMKA
jgi:para-nitrobenzyl esterase